MKRALCVVIIGVSILTLLPTLRAESLARVYIFAAWESSYRSWVPVVCDGVLVAKVKRGRFLAINVSPGQHMLTVKDSLPVFVNLRPGEEIFVQLSGKSPIPALAANPPGRARSEISNLVYVDAGRVYSTSVPKEDPSLRWQPQLKKRSNAE
jgi:hypothetical protein